MHQDKEVRRRRIGIRVIYSMGLAFYSIAVLVLALLPGLGSVLVYSGGDELLNFKMMLGGVSILCLLIGFFWPWLVRWHKKANVDDMELAYGHIVRATFFTAPVIYISTLRMLGSSWYIVLPLFILAFAALVLTFPTDKRLAKWQRGQKPPS
jgi:hypothetical protein